jgi:predicted MFS family arabinose efflux permease
MMVPQVLATLHLLFSDGSRSRAFGIYGIVLGLAGAAGFRARRRAGDIGSRGLGWRVVFFVNVPLGLIIIAAAWRSCRRCRAAPARGSTFPARSCCFAACCA